MSTVVPVEDQAPYEMDRGFILRAAGLKTGLVWTLSTSMILLLLAFLGMLVWTLYLTYEASKRFEVMVVHLDQSDRPVFTSPVDSEMVPEDGWYLAMAQDWIRYTVSRPLDEQTLRTNRRILQNHTDERLYMRMNALLKDADTTVTKGVAIDIDKIAVTIMQHKKNGVVLSLRWVQQNREPLSRQVTKTASLTVGHTIPATRDQFDRNPLGLYAIDFNITEEITQ